ncbi:histidinol dehydrogenase [Gilliamella sp. B2840]|uniref:histidinol dehydrogenase n=1 Tax=Gilliamella sp. B2840 TaxID=2817975 RepID=UPI00226A7A31|nr:histidinol dehydrogenase [Gilliamella sp. B2840]MCX8700835.1 histidinol dehydrogenase [Gilliamella sp. B2840]
MKLSYWQQCSDTERTALLTRPAITASDSISQAVTDILNQVQQNDDQALIALSNKFDKIQIQQIKLTQDAIKTATTRVKPELKQAMQLAVSNIEKFHQAQVKSAITVETIPGIKCQLVTRPIDSVGLYIPGGSAPLLSTVLMLAIPAKIAGCRNVILCSPPPIADEILYAAELCGVTEIYQLGGAQAIAALAFGSESVPKVDKIFGPGNAFVTEAKRQVSQRLDGAAIDMPAGPSEVLVIADNSANPAFIAADLLSQAEHGPDSQVVLVTPDENIAKAVSIEVDKQLTQLSRKDIAEKALQESRLIVTKDLAQCIAISNCYGPEHLIIQTQNADDLVEQITSAGSIFLGNWSPESAGDYASGTNHVLPTYGYTATYSSLGLADFQKRMTIQKLSPEGLRAIGHSVELMAQAEQLTAHKQAVTLRLAALNTKNR